MPKRKSGRHAIAHPSNVERKGGFRVRCLCYWCGNLSPAAVFATQILVSHIVIPAAYAVLRYPFMPGSESQPTLVHEIHHSVVRWGLDRFNVAQLQWALPSTSQAYKTWIVTRAKEEDSPSEVFTELVGDEAAKLHWVGRKGAKKVLLHFHGYIQLLF